MRLERIVALCSLNIIIMSYATPSVASRREAARNDLTATSQLVRFRYSEAGVRSAHTSL